MYVDFLAFKIENIAEYLKLFKAKKRKMIFRGPRVCRDDRATVFSLISIPLFGG